VNLTLELRSHGKDLGQATVSYARGYGDGHAVDKAAEAHPGDLPGYLDVSDDAVSAVVDSIVEYVWRWDIKKACEEAASGRLRAGWSLAFPMATALTSDAVHVDGKDEVEAAFAKVNRLRVLALGVCQLGFGETYTCSDRLQPLLENAAATQLPSRNVLRKWGLAALRFAGRQIDPANSGKLLEPMNELQHAVHIDADGRWEFRTLETLFLEQMGALSSGLALLFNSDDLAALPFRVARAVTLLDEMAAAPEPLEVGAAWAEVVGAAPSVPHGGRPMPG
jgi:hypothetical protein